MEKTMYLGELLTDISTYALKCASTVRISLEGLTPFLIKSDHREYYKAYSKRGFIGHRELGDRNDYGYREGFIKLEDDIFLFFAANPDSRHQFVIAFAKSREALEPILLTRSQETVFTCDYDGSLIPSEIKSPPTILHLNDSLLEKFQRDVTAFLSAETFYADRKIPYKRGTLMYGPPGNGKTSMITWASPLFDKTFRFDPDMVSPELAASINLLCGPEESKLIILEDLDSLNEHNSSLLNFVDGSVYIPKAYFIGTTNYPEKLHENILSRPSRFDLFLHIDRPNPEVRNHLLRHHLPNLSEGDYDHLVEKTKGLNASYFQEIATLKHSYELVGEEITIEEIVNECHRRVNINKTKEFRSKEDIGKVGFGN